MTKQSNLRVKMFHKHYDNGNIMIDRFAHQLNEEAYLIIKSDQTTRQVKIGEHIKDAGIVGLDHNQNLKIGQYTVLVGNEPLRTWSATPTNSKTKFKIKSPSGYEASYAVGDKIENLGILTQDENGRIYAEDKCIPIFRKSYELNLLVFPAASGPGYSSFFNKLLPGDSKNREKGIPGVFLDGNDKMPSRFCEEGPDGNLYTTAMIKPNDDGRTVRCVMRSLEDAIEEAVLKKDLEFIRITEAEPYDIDPEDIQAYVELRSRISENQAIMWQQREFSVTNGHRILGLGNAKKQSPELSR